MHSFNSLEPFIRRGSVALTLSAALVASSSVLGGTLLSENFESGVLDPMLSIQTVGGFIAQPGIQDITNFGSTKAFGFGLSNCGASCFSAHATNLIVTFNQPTFVSTISFKEMELYSNWGSGGSIFLDTSSTALPGSTFGRLPYNDFIADSTFRSHLIDVGAATTKITLHVEDITNLSEIFLDDLVVSGRVPPVPEAATWLTALSGLGVLMVVRKRSRA